MFYFFSRITNCLRIFMGRGKWSVQACLLLFVSAPFAACAHAQISFVSQNFSLPPSFECISIIKQAEWQGVGLELKHVYSQQQINEVVAQLADRVPALTPLWSEHGVLTTSWGTDSASYVLYLWADGGQKTEGLLSKLTLSTAKKLPEAANVRASSALDWLPANATQLFSMRDLSMNDPVLIHAFSVPVSRASTLEHLKQQAQNNRWLAESHSLSFTREAKRISFWVKTIMGQTIVLIYQNDRDAL